MEVFLLIVKENGVCSDIFQITQKLFLIKVFSIFFSVRFSYGSLEFTKLNKEGFVNSEMHGMEYE